ncbi:con-Ins K1-like [Montipora capricornis]
MRQSCLWSTVAILAVLLCLGFTKGDIYKPHEVGHRRVPRKFCGEQLLPLYQNVCFEHNRKRRSMLLDEEEAMSFLQHQTQRHRRQARSTDVTSIVEECCNEGCAQEEVLEYCPR